MLATLPVAAVVLLLRQWPGVQFHPGDPMLILFLHGWTSTPGGVKPTYLESHGHTVLNPALPDEDFSAAVAIAQAEFDEHRPDFVVGSSRDGAVAMNLDGVVGELLTAAGAKCNRSGSAAILELESRKSKERRNATAR
jgi:hypothetical protein